MYSTLSDFIEHIRNVNVQNGWRDNTSTHERSFPEDLVLIHSEVSEALEAYRSWGLSDVTPAKSNVYNFGNGGEYVKSPKPEGVGSELADIFIRLLDTAHEWSVDLEYETKRKIEYNATRSYRHGGKRF